MYSYAVEYSRSELTLDSSKVSSDDNSKIQKQEISSGIGQNSTNHPEKHVSENSTLKKKEERLRSAEAKRHSGRKVSEETLKLAAGTMMGSSRAKSVVCVVL